MNSRILSIIGCIFMVSFIGCVYGDSYQCTSFPYRSEVGYDPEHNSTEAPYSMPSCCWYSSETCCNGDESTAYVAYLIEIADRFDAYFRIATENGTEAASSNEINCLTSMGMGSCADCAPNTNSFITIAENDTTIFVCESYCQTLNTNCQGVGFINNASTPYEYCRAFFEPRFVVQMVNDSETCFSGPSFKTVNEAKCNPWNEIKSTTIDGDTTDDNNFYILLIIIAVIAAVVLVAVAGFAVVYVYKRYIQKPIMILPPPGTNDHRLDDL